jgi:RHS repeat-associated protein
MVCSRSSIRRHDMQGKQMMRPVMGSVLPILCVLLLLPVSVSASDPPWGGYGPTGEQNPGSPPTPDPDSDNANRGRGGDPIDLATGDFPLTEQDIFVPGRGIPLNLTRTYHTQEMYVGPFGRGWRHGYDMWLFLTSDEALDYAIVSRGDGIRIEFIDNGDGTFTPPAGRYYQLSFDGAEFQLVEKHGTTYSFDATGRLTAITDRNGNVTSLTYDASGRLDLVTDPAGRTLDFDYGANNKVATVTDPGDRVFRYGYDGNDNLTDVTDPLDRTTVYTYDIENRLVSITDARGTTWLVNVYDELNRVVSQFSCGAYYTISYEGTETAPVTAVTSRRGYVRRCEMNDRGLVTREIRDPGGLNLVTEKAYDDDLNMVSLIDPRGYTTLYEYDDNGNVTKITDAVGEPLERETSFTYEPTYNQVYSITNARIKTTYYDYDGQGNLTKITDPLTHETRFTYDPSNGDLLTVTEVRDAGNITTQYQYDEYGYRERIIDALTGETFFDYNILGNLRFTTNANLHTTEYEYDLANQLRYVTDHLTNVTEYTYDANGNLTHVTDPLDHTTEYVYDSYDRLVKIIDPLRNTTEYEYDENANLIRTTDAEDKVTVMTYDAVDRLDTVTDALTQTTDYDYDENGNLAALTDARTNTTSFLYDALNRLELMTYPDLSFEAYAYDEVGNLTSRTLPSGDQIGCEYDDLNRLITKVYDVGGTIVDTAHFGYDDLGRLELATDSDSSVARVYDDLSRIKESTQNGKVVAYDYDAVGNTTKIIYPDSDYITLTYDEIERLDTIRNAADEVIADYSYDYAGRRDQLDLANGTRTTYVYDDANRLTDLVNLVVSPESVISSFSYTHDKVGTPLSMTTVDGTHTYAYDDTYQLTGADYPEGYLFPDITFDYDEVGNRELVTDGGTTSYTPNDLNQYTDVGGTAFVHEANGNLTSDGVNTYAYDLENRMVSATTPSTTVTFGYDALGRRIEKSNTLAGETTTYVYDGPQIIAEYDVSDTLTAKYVYGAGIDEPVLMLTGTDSFFYHLDGLGSVTDLTDPAAAVVETYLYDTFGKVSTPSFVGNRFSFTGREYDAELGLYFYRARYYAPLIGRFLQRDPQAHSENVCLYGYCLNNPLKWVDPFGTEKWPWPGQATLVDPMDPFTQGLLGLLVEEGKLMGLVNFWTSLALQSASSAPYLQRDIGLLARYYSSYGQIASVSQGMAPMQDPGTQARAAADAVRTYLDILSGGNAVMNYLVLTGKVGWVGIAGWGIVAGSLTVEVVQLAAEAMAPLFHPIDRYGSRVRRQIDVIRQTGGNDSFSRAFEGL